MKTVLSSCPKILAMTMLIFLFASCMSVRRIERNCDLFAKVCGTASKTAIKYRDTTIILDRMVPVFLPKDTAKVQGVISINDTGARMPAITTKKGIVTVTAKVEDSVLTATGYINRDSLIRQIRDSILIRNALKESITSTTAVIREKHIPVFYRFSFWIVIIEIVALILYSMVKFGLVKVRRFFLS